MAMILDGSNGLTTPGVVNTAGETIATTLAVTGATNLSALTTTGNTILGDASTDTLNVGNGGLVKDASGNVGIGGTPTAVNPAGYKTLNVGSTCPNGAGLLSNGNDTYLLSACYYDTSSFKYALTSTAPASYNIANGIHIWKNAAAGTAGGTFSFTESMRIDSSSNLLVGTTTVTASARQTIAFTSSSGGTGISYIDSQANNTASFAGFYSNVTKIGSITNNGNTATAYNTSSDYRLKNTIAPMTGALDKVALLKPCTYKWNVDGSDGQGFIAHELQAVVSGCVTGEKDATREEEYEVSPAVPAVVDADGVETTPAVQAVKGTRIVPSYQGIDTSFLVATLTAAIQEQQALIIQLQADVATLKALSA